MALALPSVEIGAWSGAVFCFLEDDDKQNSPKGQSCFEEGRIGISIEIWPKMIYVDTIQCLSLISDISCQKPT
jgi:hypothetical protein